LHWPGSVWLEAIVPKEDLSALIRGMTPLTIRLGEDGRLSLGEPTDISLVENAGLRVVCAAEIHWAVLGISVPVVVRSVTVLLRPEVEERPDGTAIVFRVEIEQADFAGLPDIVDDGITDVVNHELAAKHVELSVPYQRLLGHVFELPDVLQPPERLELVAGGAQLRTTTDALALAIEMSANVHGHGESAPRAPARHEARPATVKRKNRRSWGRVALGGILAMGVLSVAFALGRATGA
jgi:hypothetical protein